MPPCRMNAIGRKRFDKGTLFFHHQDVFRDVLYRHLHWGGSAFPSVPQRYTGEIFRIYARDMITVWAWIFPFTLATGRGPDPLQSCRLYFSPVNCSSFTCSADRLSVGQCDPAGLTEGVDVLLLDSVVKLLYFYLRSAELSARASWLTSSSWRWRWCVTSRPWRRGGGEGGPTPSFGGGTLATPPWRPWGSSSRRAGAIG